jgi:hypothetical protein
MIRYAAYGSNLHPIRLTERIPAARLLGTSYIHGWSLQFHKRSPDGSGKCNILMPGNGVYVAIYEMGEADKRKLDEIEGTGSGYRDAGIDVPEFGHCATYLGSRSYLCNDLAPYDWYREMVLLGCQKQKFPDRYTSVVGTVTTSPDPDEVRSQQQWQIVERLRNDL